MRIVRPPIISLGGYALIAAAPILSNIRIVKIFENGTDYSLENTVRQALFLPTSREAKYAAGGQCIYQLN
jgi:AAA family ATP:ADP antiporter